MTAYYELTVYTEACLWHGSGEHWARADDVKPVQVALRAESYEDAVEKAKAILPPLKPQSARLRYCIEVDRVTEVPATIPTKRVRYRGVS
jgi:hypothetical protein